MVVQRSDGTRVDTTWGCCGKERETGADGTVMEFLYDALDRADHATKLGLAAGQYAAQADIVTEYVLDAAGRRVSESVSADGIAALTATSTYDLAGRLTRTVRPARSTVVLVHIAESVPSGPVYTVVHCVPSSFTP